MPGIDLPQPSSSRPTSQSSTSVATNKRVVKEADTERRDNAQTVIACMVEGLQETHQRRRTDAISGRPLPKEGQTRPRSYAFSEPNPIANPTPQQRLMTVTSKPNVGQEPTTTTPTGPNSLTAISSSEYSRVEQEPDNPGGKFKNVVKRGANAVGDAFPIVSDLKAAVEACVTARKEMRSQNAELNTATVNDIYTKVARHLLGPDSPVTRATIQEISENICRALMHPNSLSDSVPLLDSQGHLNKAALLTPKGSTLTPHDMAQKKLMIAVREGLKGRFQDDGFTAMLTKTITHDSLLGMGWPGVKENFDFEHFTMIKVETASTTPKVKQEADSLPKIPLLESATQFTDTEIDALRQAGLLTSGETGLGRLKHTKHKELIAKLTRKGLTHQQAEELGYKMGFYRKDKLEECATFIKPEGKENEARHRLRSGLREIGVLDNGTGHLKRPLNTSDVPVLFNHMTEETEPLTEGDLTTVNAFDSALISMSQSDRDEFLSQFNNKINVKDQLLQHCMPHLTGVEAKDASKIVKYLKFRHMLSKAVPGDAQFGMKKARFSTKGIARLAVSSSMGSSAIATGLEIGGKAAAAGAFAIPLTVVGVGYFTHGAITRLRQAHNLDKSAKTLSSTATAEGGLSASPLLSKAKGSFQQTLQQIQTRQLSEHARTKRVDAAKYAVGAAGAATLSALSITGVGGVAAAVGTAIGTNIAYQAIESGSDELKGKEITLQDAYTLMTDVQSFYDELYGYLQRPSEDAEVNSQMLNKYQEEMIALMSDAAIISDALPEQPEFKEIKEGLLDTITHTGQLINYARFQLLEGQSEV